MANRLNANDDLKSIGSISSPNGRSTFVMQGDGNLVLYRADGKARWATATNGRSVAQAVMQGDGNFVMYGPGGSYIWDTGTDGHPGAYLLIQDDGNVVVYEASGRPLWATNTSIVRRMVSGFLPSTSGLHFPNSFAQVPDIKINILGNQIGIGDASKGLCGGMVFVVRDYFLAGIMIPPDTSSPSSGALFDYIVKRLFDSFNLFLPPPPPPHPGLFVTPTPPFGPGPLTYMHLMNPDLPDHETVASNLLTAPRGRAWVAINEEWPKIKADLDSGELSPVALVEIKSYDPTTMGMNHQVLAYGYELDATNLSIYLYDPNEPDNDSVTMSLSLADPQHTTEIKNSVVPTVWCFFRPIYMFSSPPPFNVAWEPLGGTVASAPAACSWASGRLDVFGRGTDNALWHKWFNGGWSGWEQLGPNPIASNPAAVSWGPDRIDVFAKGTDNALWHKWWDGSRWSSYESLGGALSSGPAVCAWGSGRLDVFARGTDNALWHKWYDGRWSGWEQLGPNPIASDPAAVSWGPNRIDVFVKGTDNGLWHKWWDGSRWSSYEGLGGTLTSGPGVCSRASGRLDVFARGVDNALWNLRFDGMWRRWQQLGANPIASEPAAVSWGPNRMDVFVRGTDNALHHRWWDGGWKP